MSEIRSRDQGVIVNVYVFVQFTIENKFLEVVHGYRLQ